MIKKNVLLIFVLLIFSSFVSAETVPDGGEFYWNFIGLTDLWDGQVITGSGVITSNDYPVFNLFGNSSPNSYEFTGDINDFLRYPDGLMSFLNTGTVSFWTKINSGVNGVIFGGQDSVGTANYVLIQVNGDDKVQVQARLSATNQYIFESDDTVPLNEWAHIVWTKTGSTHKIYINGVESTLSDVITPIDESFYYDGLPAPTEYYSGRLTRTTSILPFDGLVDVLKFYNKSLSVTEVGNLYGCNNITSCGEPPAVNESLESTIFGGQLSNVTLTTPSFVTILSADFNVSVNNTPAYMAVNGQVLSTSASSIECRIDVNGELFNSTISRDNVANTIGNFYITTINLTLPSGLNTATLECRKVSGGPATIFGSVGIGHLLIDEFNNSITYEHIVFTNTTNSTDFQLLKSYNFTLNELNDSDNIINHFIIDWSSNYINNNGTGLLNSFIQIEGYKNCSQYPRYILAGDSASIGGDCLLDNVSANTTLTLNVFGSGSDGEFSFNIHNKQLYTGADEASSLQFNSTSNRTSDFSLLFNVPINNTHHDNSNMFAKLTISTKGNDTGTIEGFVTMRDGGFEQNTSVFSRSYSTEFGVSIFQWVFQNVSSDNYSIDIYSRCVEADCELNSVGTFITYMTDVTTVEVNAFNVSVFDNFDNSSISDFNVTNNEGAVFSSTDGWVLVFTDEDLTENLTIQSDFNGGYFSTIIVNHNVTEDLDVNLNQTLVSWNCLEVVSGADLNCTSPSESSILNYNVVGNPHTQQVNLTNYFDVNTTFNVSALDNKTLNSTHGYLRTTFNSSSGLGTVNNCNYTLISNTYSSSIKIEGNPDSTIDLINDTYNVTVDCEGFAVITESVNIFGSFPSFISVNFTLFTENSVNFIFKDADTLDILNGTNVTISFISASSFTNTTSAGKIFLDLITPSDYTLTVSAEDYRQTQYFLSIIDRTTQNVTILLQKTNNSELVLISVKDKFSGAPIKISKVTVQKFVDNSWITDQILQTDFQGRTEGHFVLSDVFYNFLVEFENQTFFGVINSNEDKKLIFAEDVSNGILIEIDLDPNVVIDIYQEIYDINTDLTFTNLSNTTGRYRFGFVNNNGFDTTGNLIVLKGGVVVCNETVTSSTGTLFCNVNVSIGETATFTAGGFVNGELVQVRIDRIDDAQKFIEWGVLGFFIGLIIAMFSVFLLAKVPSLSVLTGYSSVALLIFLSVIFKNISISMWIILIVIAFIIFRIPKKVSV